MANEPPFAEYPRPSGPSIGYSGRGPGVYFDSIGEAWGIVRSDFGTWIPAVLIVLAITYPLIIPFSLLTAPLTQQGPNSTLPGILFGSVIQIAVGLIPNIISQMLIAGAVGMGVRQLRGEPINVGMVFDPFRNFGPMFLTSLLFMGVLYLSILACGLPALYFGPVLTLMPVVAFLKRLPPMEAMKVTYAACKSHWLGLLGLFVVTSIVAALGACACGIGILFTYPIFFVVLAIHYRAFFESQLPNGGEMPPTGY